MTRALRFPLTALVCHAAALGAMLGAARGATLGAQEPGRAAPSEGVGFRAAITPDTVFVGQQVTYSLTVRIPTEVRQRLRRNPEFVPPEARAMLAYDLPLSRIPATDEEVEVHVFRRALFPLTPGRYQIPTARLSYSIPQSPSFFSREEERTMRSEAVGFVAIEAPTRGRPADWLGAVGRWEATVRADAEGARVGDPFVLVLRLQGQGNAALLPRPALDIAWADVVPHDERIVLDSTPTLFSGAKEFSWLVTPRVNGTQTVAALEYPYFEPSTRQYLRASTLPLRLAVRAGDYVTMPTRATAQASRAPLTLRAALAGAAPVAIPGAVLWTWLAALAPLVWITGRLAAQARAEGRARAAQAVAATRVSGRQRFDAMVEARTGIVLARVTAPGQLAAALRLEGVTEGTASEVESLRDAYDTQSFARRARSPQDDLTARAAALLARIDHEARRRALPILLLALTLVVGCVRPAGAIDATRAFADGATAYAGADYARARDAFRRSAAAAPRDPNAWANLGTAAWQAGDTASAVQGWQRALRLSPRDGELRGRLSLVRAPQLRGTARVWPVPPLPIAVLALALWFAGWGWASRRTWRGRAAGTGPLALILPALVLGVAAAWLDSTLQARDLAVVSVPSPLLALPALGADHGAVPLVGEIARIRERRGVWVRLELGADRAGWYPAERTLPLARD